jgi:hypothetical protein
MAHYVLIDNESGYIFWQGFAATEMDAAEQANNEINLGEHYEYEYTDQLASTETGYLVYQVEADYPEIEDGQDELTIQAVEQREMTARVRCIAE